MRTGGASGRRLLADRACCTDLETALLGRATAAIWMYAVGTVGLAPRLVRLGAYPPSVAVPPGANTLPGN
jgi:hypothetical protein